VKHLVPFHHDPAHTDADLDRLLWLPDGSSDSRLVMTPGTEGASFELAG
jgi:hypothetical protein